MCRHDRSSTNRREVRVGMGLVLCYHVGWEVDSTKCVHIHVCMHMYVHMCVHLCMYEHACMCDYVG